MPDYVSNDLETAAYLASIHTERFHAGDHRTCPDCGEVIINAGAHFERCYGQIAHGHCDCPPGFQHRPDCHHVAGGAS